MDKPKSAGMESLLIGKTIDHYEIAEVIGKGGMGIVFRAIDKNLDRDVAIKIMHTRLSEEQGVLDRFRVEGKSQAKLNHPNIVDIYSLSDSPFGLYIAMEFIDGIDLGRKIRSVGPLSWSDALIIIEDVAEAVAHAHRKGILHRDIKPSNIMLDHSGAIKVTDFGLAKAQDIGLTSTGSSGGTIVYSAPEQVRSLKAADTRSDIYSIGMTLYETLNGTIPIEGDSAISMQLAILQGNIPPIGEVMAELPDGLIHIIGKATEQDPNNRYQSIEELLTDVREFKRRDGKVTFVSSNVTEKKPYASRVTFWAFSVVSLIFLGLMVWTPWDNSANSSMDPDPGLETSLAGVNPPAARDTVTTEIEPGIDSTEEIKMPVLGSVEVQSRPPGAQIWLNGSPLNQPAPMALESLAQGTYEIGLSLSGYQPVSETVEISAGETHSVTRHLIRLTGNVILSSSPPGAQITMNGDTSRVFHSSDTVHAIPTGEQTFLFQLDGHEPMEIIAEVMPDSSSLVEVALKRHSGKLSILVLPYGSISIDGSVVRENAHREVTLDLAADTHAVRVAHPTFGEWNQEIAIVHGEDRDLTIDFNRFASMRITAFDIDGKPVPADIYVDGENTRFSTPKALSLRIGTHTIELRAPGFIPVAPPLVINLNEDLSRPLRFEFRKQ